MKQNDRLNAMLCFHCNNGSASMPQCYVICKFTDTYCKPPNYNLAFTTIAKDLKPLHLYQSLDLLNILHQPLHKKHGLCERSAPNPRVVWSHKSHFPGTYIMSPSAIQTHATSHCAGPYNQSRCSIKLLCKRYISLSTVQSN
jgi:hypothetical protein